MSTSNGEPPIHEILRGRYSPYGFSDEPVSAGDLRSLFEAARWAASSYNEQPWRFLVARKDEPEAFERALSCLVPGNQAWARFAPVLVLCCYSARFERNGKDNKAAQHDLGLALGNLMAEATARGLYVHAMIGIDPEAVRERCAVPDGFEALTAFTVGRLGRPADLDPAIKARDDRERTRRPLRDTVFTTRFGERASWLE